MVFIPERVQAVKSLEGKKHKTWNITHFCKFAQGEDCIGCCASSKRQKRLTAKVGWHFQERQRSRKVYFCKCCYVRAPEMNNKVLESHLNAKTYCKYTTSEKMVHFSKHSDLTISLLFALLKFKFSCLLFIHRLIPSKHWVILIIRSYVK